MARYSPKEAQSERKGKSEPDGGSWVKHEKAEKKAYEKAEEEDKSLHKVVTKAMKKIAKKGK